MGGEVSGPETRAVQRRSLSIVLSTNPDRIRRPRSGPDVTRQAPSQYLWSLCLDHRASLHATSSAGGTVQFQRLRACRTRVGRARSEEAKDRQRRSIRDGRRRPLRRRRRGRRFPCHVQFIASSTAPSLYSSPSSVPVLGRPRSDLHPVHLVFCGQSFSVFGQGRDRAPPPTSSSPLPSVRDLSSSSQGSAHIAYIRESSSGWPGLRRRDVSHSRQDSLCRHSAIPGRPRRRTWLCQPAKTRFRLTPPPRYVVHVGRLPSGSVDRQDPQL